MTWGVWALALAGNAQSPPPDALPPAGLGAEVPTDAGEAPGPNPAVLSLDRFVEIDRRQRRVYRLGVSMATIGAGVEVTGAILDVDAMTTVGGAMEASGAPVMTYAALRSGLALHRLDAAPLPWLGFLGTIGFVVDLGATGASQLPGLPLESRQRLAVAAIGTRVATYTLAILQQTINRSGRRRLGLRTHRVPESRIRVALAPTVQRDRVGLTLLVGPTTPP